MMRITDTVKHLIIINVIMFIGSQAIGGGRLFYDLFALHFPANDAFKPWQVVTSMFMHSGFQHLLFNMIALWMFGVAVEQRLGAKKFLFIYFSAGLGAVLFQLGYYYYDYFNLLSSISDLGLSNSVINELINVDAREGNFIKGELLQQGIQTVISTNNLSIPTLNQYHFNTLFNLNVLIQSTMVGASGCIMGIMAAFAVQNPNAELMMLFLPIPIKAKYFVPGIILLDVISAVSGQSFFSPSNTAYMAHVGGAITGFIIMWYWKKNQFNSYRID